MIWGYFLIFISAASFGLMPIFTIYAYKSGISLTTLLFLRFAFTAIFFFGYLVVKGQTCRLGKKMLFSLLLLGGVLYTLQSFFYFSSVKYIPASLAALLLYLYPIFVAILSFLINKENVSKRLLFSILISLSGMILVLGTPSGKINAVGVFMAVCAGVVYSLYIVIGNRVTSKADPLITCAFISLFAAISFLLAGAVTHTIEFSFGVLGWISILGIALVSSVVAMFTFSAGMNRTGPTKASILSMVEPVVTIGFSTLLFQEKMSLFQTIGALIVLTGAILVVLARETKTSTEKETSSITQ